MINRWPSPKDYDQICRLVYERSRINLGPDKQELVAARLGKRLRALNLPTKKFYSPKLTIADVETLSREMLEKVRAAEHPFILGSECDVLSVPGSEEEILSKVCAPKPRTARRGRRSGGNLSKACLRQAQQKKIKVA